MSEEHPQPHSIHRSRRPALRWLQSLHNKRRHTLTVGMQRTRRRWYWYQIV